MDRLSGSLTKGTIMARQRNLFDPSSPKPYKLSRSRLELFLNCPRCFYLDRRLGVDRPPGFPFNLNLAVDSLLKREFDYYRERGERHPYMIEAGVEAVPAQPPNVGDATVTQSTRRTATSG